MRALKNVFNSMEGSPTLPLGIIENNDCDQLHPDIPQENG